MTHLFPLEASASDGRCRRRKRPYFLAGRSLVLCGIVRRALATETRDIEIAPTLYNFSGVEVAWQLPKERPRAVYMLFHGANSFYTDWFDMPEGRVIVRHLLSRNFAVVAPCSADHTPFRGFNISAAAADHMQVTRATMIFYHLANIPAEVPAFGVGSSMGADFLYVLHDVWASQETELTAALRRRGSSTDGKTLAALEEKSIGGPWNRGFDGMYVMINYIPNRKHHFRAPFPPVAILRMPRDTWLIRTIKYARTLEALTRDGAPFLELTALPWPVSPRFFTDRIETLTASDAKAIVAALIKEDVLNEECADDSSVYASKKGDFGGYGAVPPDRETNRSAPLLVWPPNGAAQLRAAFPDALNPRDIWSPCQLKQDPKAEHLDVVGNATDAVARNRRLQGGSLDSYGWPNSVRKGRDLLWMQLSQALSVAYAFHEVTSEHLERWEGFLWEHRHVYRQRLELESEPAVN